MPFVSVNLVNHMLSLRNGFDAVVPELGDRPEPTHAVYSKACLEPMRRKLDARQLKIAGFFDDVKVNMVPEGVVNRFDPEHLSFFNVNTQEDLDRAVELADQGF